ncbi:smalltalk protein [Prevotella sp.]|nr:smalltalk protein [Prevotella sp.]
MTKINWSTVLKIIVAVASAILGTLGVQGMVG